MDLWIKSQDDGLFKIKIIKPLVEDGSVWTYLENTNILLGTYKNKERALEVLDEIKNIIYFNRLFNADISVFKECLEDEFKMSEREMNSLLKRMSVYEMPKE